jgi:hypothetical protein
MSVVGGLVEDQVVLMTVEPVWLHVDGVGE